jgi:hypothetical protein
MRNLPTKKKKNLNQKVKTHRKYVTSLFNDYKFSDLLPMTQGEW